MKNVLTIIQLIVSVLLVGCILLQAKGTGFGTTFSNVGSYSTKRGMEKFVFTLTIILIIIFGSLSIFQLFK